MNQLIQQIKSMATLEIPKSQHDRQRVVSAFGSIASESNCSWFVPCTHSLNSPADNCQIAAAEQSLGYSIPVEYKQFLKISNGGDLFIVPRNRPKSGEPHIRYSLLSCEGLVKVNQFLVETFRAAYSNDPEYKDVATINYMAFCDATNDNYQAMVLDGPHANRVFLLFYEFQCRPYSELDSEFYYTISESLQSWFELLLQTGGWGGRGTQSGSL